MLHKKKNLPQNLFIYGKHAVFSALENPKRKHKTLYATPQIFNEFEKEIRSFNVKYIICDKNELDKIVPLNSNHQNIILETTALEPYFLEDILDKTSEKKFSCIVILDQVKDPHNIGAIIRTAAAFSADAVILPENNSPKENNTIIKCSAGAIDITPFLYVNNIVNTIKTLKKEGYWITGLDGDGEYEVGPKVFANKLAIILGSEESGMRKLVKENCDYIAKISISSKVESLNVSTAAAIALHSYKRYTEEK